MKIRTDFVTNSSSSSFCVAITVVTKDGTQCQLHIEPTDAYVGGGGEAVLEVKEKNIFGAKDVDSLITYLTDSVVFEDGDLAFEDCEVDCAEYSVKSIRKLLRNCEVDYFTGVMQDINQFRAKVTAGAPSLKDIDYVKIENTHNAWGEFSDLFEIYLEEVGILIPEEGDNWIEDKTFVITGKLQFFSNRGELVEFIEDCGGSVANSVSKKTHYLINNDTQSKSGKNVKAKQLGIPVISEKDFILRFCDEENLDVDVMDEIDDELLEYRDRIIAMLKERLSADSSFDQLADCAEEFCEPNSFEGTRTQVFDMHSKTVTESLSITID